MTGLLQKLKFKTFRFKILPSLIGGLFLLCSFKACTPDTPVPALTAKQCLTVNAFYEAKGEGLKGMQAVSAVVYNRVQSKKYPNTVCKVVFQDKQFSWTHQQSYSSIRRLLEGDLRLLNYKDRQAYQLALEVAKTPRKFLQKSLGSSKILWYHSSTVQPKWAKKMLKVKTIKNHLFYVSRGG